MKSTMSYKTLDYMTNGIIVANIEKSEVIYINTVARQTLKIGNNEAVNSLHDLITDEEVLKKLKKRVLVDNKKFGSSEGIINIKALDGAFIEVNFCCVFENEYDDIIHCIFKKATEVVGESHVSFKELAEHLPSGITVMDIENELSITYANHEHYKILGIEDVVSEEVHLLKDFIYEEDVNWVISEIYLNLSHNEDVDIEFRMKTKGDIVKWVRLYGRANVSASGKRVFYSSLKDLSQRQSINDKLHMERVLFHKITELSDEIIFKLDLKTNIMNFLGNKNEIFNEISVFENYPESVLKLHKVHPEDIHIHSRLMEYFKNGIEKPLELRYLLGEDVYEWHRITFTFICDSQSNPTSVIGKISNVNSRKILEEQAKTDLLTNLYNKMTTEHEVNRLLRRKNDQCHGFFIVDIDNFKAINDNLGHHFGDTVLNEIASDIKSCFRTKDILGRVSGKDIDDNVEITVRKKDILGRIGGDEFVIVMRNVDNEDIVLDKAQIICSLLNKTYSDGENSDKKYSISASVGISMFPKHGQTYEELYKKSDLALYEIKKGGKNEYKMYSENRSAGRRLPVPEKLKPNSLEARNINNVVMSTVLNLLYETKDLSVSIVSILKYLGNLYKLDKCYIFDITDKGNSYNDRYKWHRQSATEDVTEYISNEILYSVLDLGDKDGIFYTNDIYSIEDKNVVELLEEDGVESLFLLESIKVKNESIVLGLEDCTKKRVWSEEEIITLLHVGKLIFTALNNDRNINLLMNHNKQGDCCFNGTSIIDYDEIANIICSFYDANDTNVSLIGIVRNIVKLFEIDRANSMIYNDKLCKYFKSYDCTLNGSVTDYSQELDQYYKQCINTLTHENDENIHHFLSLFNDQNYIYTDNYNEIKDYLKNAGFTSKNEDKIKEIYIFATEHNSFFGYIAFERYSDKKLTDVQINILTALCNVLNSDIEKFDLVQKYEDDILMKNVILQNEKIPMAVIEKDTFKILYHNELYYTIFPNIEIGGICYELQGHKEKCAECCIDKDILMNDANHSDHQWIKKAIPFTLNNGTEAYMIYSKDSIDYVNQLNAVDNLTQALLLRGFEEYYKNVILKNANNYALCTIDVDKFKYINDMFGYKVGDKVLRKISMVIRDFIGNGESFCRMSEDKFAIFLCYKNEDDINYKIKSLSKKFNEMKERYFEDVKITIMGGITLVDKESNLNTLLDQSTIARKSAKGSHTNNFAFYNAEIDEKLKQEIHLEERIPYAIANDEFVPFLQPKFNLKTKKICGAEALVRWVTDKGMIYPDQFIPLFERNGFILTLDFIVYEKVMEHIKKCLDNNLPVYPVSVNVSRNHIKDKNFMIKFKKLIEKYKVPLKYLELEITESVFVEDKNELINFVNGIKENSIKVSIDDFGTAYSSLQNLTEIDVDILKIDKGFLDNIDISKKVITKDEILIKNIINLAKELDFNVICEGVETDEQIELLKKVGCEYGQGYVFARPMSLYDYEKQFL